MIYFSEAMPRSFLIKTLRTVESPPPAPPPNYSPPPSQRPPSPRSTSESPPRCCGDRHTSAFSLVSPREARIKEAAATVRGKGMYKVVLVQGSVLHYGHSLIFLFSRWVDPSKHNCLRIIIY